MHFGPYEVTAQIGAGGMGEVYRARDTRLGRDVALKVLPEAFVADPDRVARFQREAQTLAALNHPHIGGIHGLEEAAGVTALVLELVEGPTLADRLESGSIPVDEALSIARQIAEALEAAHEQGIVHRDLKPANIKLRPDDVVKVLDFGLAKAVSAESAAGSARDLSHSPTLTTPAATRIGTIMGTAAYMSPEQARGKPVDRRTDVWALGCVLYEMLTGRRAFIGDDVSDVLASILAREPDFAALPAAVPPAIRRLLRRCLEKDRGERLRDIGDARIEIRDVLAKADAHDTVRASRSSKQRRLPLVLVAALSVIALVAVAALLWMFPRAPASPEVRLDITTPPTPVLPSLAVSPDGRAVVFVASTPDGRSRLWLRGLDSGSARQLPGTDTAQHPFWSPDSRSVGFFADSTLKRIDIDGGSIRGLTNIYRGTGGTWNRNGVILVSSLGDPIARVSATGGEHAELSGLFQQGSNFSPYFLPDGRRFLYYVRGTPEVSGVYAGQLDGTLPPRRLTEADNAGVAYLASGYLLFVRQRTLYAQRFDPAALTLSGDPFPIAPGCGCVGISASDNGSVAYRTTSGAGRRQFAWFDRSGDEIAKVVDSGGMSSPSLSPDGQQVVGYRGNPVDGNVDVWLLDVRRGAFTRLTDDVGDDVGPVWSPDGTRITFASNRKGTHDIYQKPASGGGREELLFSDPNEKGVSDWSPDGRFVLFDRRELKKRSDVWALPLNGDGKPIPVSNSDFEELRGQFSPDGNWVAYQSDESGRHEIYIQPFPGPGRKSPVSTGGGSQVRWRRDGQELFYVGLDGRLMAVPVALASNGQAPVIGAPGALFTPPLGGMVQIADFRPQYMVSPDGQRFLIATFAEGPLSPITVILNWKPKP